MMGSLPGFNDHFRQSFAEVVGQRVLVALSGGADSVALLHLLSHPDLGLELDAAYVHHQTRSAEADLEVESCRRLCDRLQICFHHLTLEPAPTSGEGREATWRALRYRQLRTLAATLKARFIATGHQRDDIAEGVLMQLLRGGGPRALAGIAAMTDEGLIRPLLPWPHAAIVDWLRSNHIGWSEDSSNTDLTLVRNRVRHQVLPGLEEGSPGVRDHLVHLAAALAADEAFIGSELKRRAQWIDPWEPDGGVPISILTELPPPLRTRWLHLQAARCSLGRVSRRQLSLFDSLLEHGRPRALSLNRRWRLRRAAGKLWLEPPQELPAYSFDLEVDSTVRLPLPGWEARLATAPGSDARWRHKVPTGVGIVLRSPLPGDRLTDPARPRKLSRLLAKTLPRHLRRAWPVLSVDDTIAWIPGLWQGPEPEESSSLIVEVMHSV